MNQVLANTDESPQIGQRWSQLAIETMKVTSRLANGIILFLTLVLGCSNAQETKWQEFEKVRIINNLESQQRALEILRKIESIDPDSIHKGSSVRIWIERWEATVDVYKEREKINEKMWAY